MRSESKTERLTIASLLLAVGIILPFAASHGLGIPGTVLLPMHIPVLLAGILLGPLLGAVLGCILPPLNTLLTGMPPLYPMMPIMTAELLTYGLVSGLLYHKTPLKKTKSGVYVAMLTAMAAGRISYGIVFQILMLAGTHQALSVTAALVTGIPGIIIQLLLVPSIAFTVGKMKMKEKDNIFKSAENLIADGRATLVVIKDGKIVSTECARGISPIITAYERGILKDAVVVDKIVGKAAAAVMTLGGVKHCYGLTMSSSAREYFNKNKISSEYKILTDLIVNRVGDGPCPMECAVENIENPSEALAAIKQKLDELREGK